MCTYCALALEYSAVPCCGVSELRQLAARPRHRHGVHINPPGYIGTCTKNVLPNLCLLFIAFMHVAFCIHNNQQLISDISSINNPTGDMGHEALGLHTTTHVYHNKNKHMYTYTCTMHPVYNLPLATNKWPLPARCASVPFP
jgi:hypothetical protein